MIRKKYIILSISVLFILIITLYCAKNYYDEKIYSENYYSEIKVDLFSEEKGYVLGTVVKSNHLPEGTVVGFKLNDDLINGDISISLAKEKNQTLIVKYHDVLNTELLAKYPKNPVDLVDVYEVKMD